MKIKIPKFKELPLEVGKTYMTKFATKERFTLTRDPYKRKDGIIYHVDNTVYGIYENVPHLGECPLNIDRLIHEKEKIGEIEVCSKCKTPLSENEVC